jgi:hypothetical protein
MITTLEETMLLRTPSPAGAREQILQVPNERLFA